MKVDRETVLQSAASVHGVGTWKRGKCFVCASQGKDDNRAKFALHVSGGFSCKRCGAHGRLSDRELESLNIVAEYVEKKVLHTLVEIPESFTLLSSEQGWTGKEYKFAHDYLATRPQGGLTPEQILACSIGACTVGRFRNRVVMPVFAEDGESWVGYSTRATWKNPNVPYLNCTGMLREILFYNWSTLHVETDIPLLVMEGAFDCIAHFENSIGLLGVASEWQLDQLANCNRPVVFVLDGDAWELAQGYAMRLRFEGQSSGFVKLPPHVDPDELHTDDLLELAFESLSADM